MRKTKSLTRVASAPLALAVAMIASSAAFAADVEPAVKAAMQRDLGLSGQQLAQYLKTERLAAQQEKALQKQLGGSYAGSWIERKGNGSFRFVVASTKGGKAAAGAEMRQVRHSLAALNASKGQLDMLLAQGAKVPKGVYGWYVHVPTNSVVVNIGAGAQQAGIDFVARSGMDADTVRFETMDEAPRLHLAVQGGLGILRNPGDGYLYACSVGFPVTQGSTMGFATAGHCGDTGEVTYHEPSQWTLGVRLGTYAASNFPNPGQTGPDMAWVRVDSGHTLSPSVYGWGKGDVTVRGASEAAVGAAICRSGRTSGWRCGTVEAKNQTVNYQTGETILNLTRTTACSEGGDSGGSFITTPGQAQGVLSGGSGSCKGGGRRSRSFFQPINPILSTYNLSLVTSP